MIQPFSPPATSVFVAANDATADEKAIADYLCDGAADQTEIETALAAATTANLSSGTFNISAGITIPAYGKLIGQAGWATAIHADMAGVAIGMSDSCTVQDIALDSTGAVTVAEGITAGSHGTLTNVMLVDQQSGIAMIRVSDITITNAHFVRIRAASTWAACIHTNAGVDGVTINGFYAEDCDRGSENEDGASNIVVRNGTLTDIDEYLLDAHAHEGVGPTGPVLFENFTLTGCHTLECYGSGTGATSRAVGITYRNIEIVNPTLGESEYAISIIKADEVLLDTITLTGAPEGYEYWTEDADVTLINCSWV